MTRPALALALAVAFGCPARSARAQVEVRGETRPLDGEIIRISPAGVEIRVQGEPTGHLVGWDRIRRVTGPRTLEAAQFNELSDSLWRARVRLERHDRRASELLFDSAYAKHAGLTGPSGAVLAEGVLRTRLSRGAQATAIMPWLDWLQIRYSAGQKQMDSWIGGKIALPEIIDAARNLCPRLPPIFSTQDDPVGLRLLADPGTWTRYDQADQAVKDVASLYRAAAQFELDPANTPMPQIKTTEDYVLLVSEIVKARIGTPEERKESRSRLSRRLAALALQGDDLSGESAAGSSRYLEAWCRVAIGRSMLRDATPVEVRAGVIEMLHAPARLADAAPELARLVLLDAADAMTKINELAAASTLRDEAKTRFAGSGPIDEIPIVPPPTTEEPVGDPTMAPAGEEGAG